MRTTGAEVLDASAEVGTFVEAVSEAQAAIYAAGYRDGRTDTLLEADRELTAAVHRIFAAIRGGDLL